MILVDSSVWVDYLNGVNNWQTQRLESLLPLELLAIGDLILVEVLQGISDENVARRVERLLTSLAIVQLGGEALALQAARNFRVLRRNGITVRKTIDTMIATFCIENDYDLLHNDRDFSGFVKILGLREVA